MEKYPFSFLPNSAITRPDLGIFILCHRAALSKPLIYALYNS